MSARQPNVDLAGKTAIVTGASSGIGKAISAALAAEGAHVYLAGRTQAHLDAAAKEIREAGGKVTAVTFDVRDVKQMQPLVERAVEETGRLDIFVNNAGLSYPGTIAEQEPEEWREMLEVNVLALLVGCQAAIRSMRRRGSAGHIVNISSVAGRLDARGVYGATKAAVNSIATTLFKELEEDSIRVVNVCPGAVATNFARNFDPTFVQGFAKAVGIEHEVRKGERLPDDVIEQLQERAKKVLASADDIARAVLYAVTQPPEVDVFEITVRPQKALSF